MDIMCKKINISLVFFIILGAFFSSVVFSPVLAAEDRTTGLGGLSNTAEESGYKKTSELAEGEEKASGKIAVIVGQIIRVIISLLGVVFAILIFMGGFDIAGANGNEELVKKGKERITNGAKGILVVLVAYTIASVAIAWVTKGGEIFKLQ